MRPWLSQIGRMAVTLVVAAVAAYAGWRLWVHYQQDPWTPDGRIRADVAEVAPDVGGLVQDVRVRDNQVVRKGDLLFVIDPPRYRLALRQAEAAVANQRAALGEAQREVRRNLALGDLVAREVTEQSQTRLAQARAALAQAETSRDLAQLNLSRTEVRAPVDGTLSYVLVRPGDYLPAGRTALALVEAGSIHVDGYFEETKLRRIRIGDRASVRIMGEPGLLYGRVQSMAPGVTDRDRSEAPNLLPNVNPVFSWVRLAQRIPVRVVLDSAPSDLRLVAGRTATVTILEPAAASPRKAGR